MLHEGVYGLSFALPAAEAERVDAIAVLRSGRLIGSDPNGGVFKGCYRYEDDSREAVIDVQLTVPPHGELLTGLSAGPQGLTLDLTGRFTPPCPVSTGFVEVAGERVSVELRFVGPLAR